MAYFSSFWYKHYKDIGNCCMTAPLEVPPTLLKKMPNTPTSRTVLTYIDTGWMSEKKLKWIGWDVDGWITWIDPNGIMYRVRDLKRNGDGIEFEKNYEELKTQVNPEKPVYTSVLAYYTHEMNVQKTCGYCPDRSSVPSDDDDTDSSENTGGVTQQNVTAPPWQTFAGGGTPDYGGINTGSNPYVPSANYGGYGDIYTEYTPPTANPSETVKTDGVTDTTGVTGIIKTQIDPLKPAGLKPLPDSPVKTSPRESVPISPYVPNSDEGIKKQEVAKIDELRIKPNIPPKNEQITFPKPAKPIKNIDKWFKQPDQNPATKPSVAPPTPKPTPKPAPKKVPTNSSEVNTSSSKSGENKKSELAKEILISKNIELASIHVSEIPDGATPLDNIKDIAAGRSAKTSSYGHAKGSAVVVDIKVLSGLLKLAEKYKFSISEIAGGKHTTKNSNHYKGISVDINVLNEEHVGKNHPDAKSFIKDATNVGFKVNDEWKRDVAPHFHLDI